MSKRTTYISICASTKNMKDEELNSDKWTNRHSDCAGMCTANVYWEVIIVTTQIRTVLHWSFKICFHNGEWWYITGYISQTRFLLRAMLITMSLVCCIISTRNYNQVEKKWLCLMQSPIVTIYVKDTNRTEIFIKME